LGGNCGVERFLFRELEVGFLGFLKKFRVIKSEFLH
jgi:hypothetical protein